MRHVHFIGIGGSGLSAIAQVLLERGYTVSGSDRQASPVLSRLQQAGARVMLNHRAENIFGADLVIRSSAVHEDNVEVLAARQAGFPVLKRSEFLGSLTENNRVIAIAGTHGKTTTTAMIAWILHELGLDPSYIIGGNSIDLAGNAHAGKGDEFVIEADEYDGMFLGLSPSIAVVTNIEHDHPDCYPTPDAFYLAFSEFSKRISPDGYLIACSDDVGAARLAYQRVEEGKHTLFYGIEEAGVDYRAESIRVNKLGGYDFTLRSGNGFELAKVALQVPGVHNVLNATAALAVVDVLNLSMEKSLDALQNFRGTGRRFEVRGEPAGVVLIDDYAHHPSEINSTLAAARARYGDRRIWVVWQPHTYSRTQMLYADFCSAFGEADCLIVTDIFAARETAPENGFSGENLVHGIRQDVSMAGKFVTFVPSLEEAIRLLDRKLEVGDVLLVLSAGDATQINDALLELKSGSFKKEIIDQC